MFPKYLSEPDWKVNKKRSVKQEKKVAHIANGFTVPGSGSGRFKGDVQSRDFKIECKTTTKDSIRLSATWLEKIASEALNDGRYPVLAIELCGKMYFVLNEFNFKDYQEYLKRDV
jgi:Holliday junction resolvase